MNEIGAIERRGRGMNRLEKIDRAVTRWTRWGEVEAPVRVPDLADLVAVARAVNAYQNAGMRAVADAIDRGPAVATNREHRLEMTRCRDALATAMEPLLEEVNGE